MTPLFHVLEGNFIEQIKTPIFFVRTHQSNVEQIDKAITSNNEFYSRIDPSIFIQQEPSFFRFETKNSLAAPFD